MDEDTPRPLATKPVYKRRRDTPNDGLIRTRALSGRSAPPRWYNSGRHGIGIVGAGEVPFTAPTTPITPSTPENARDMRQLLINELLSRNKLLEHLKSRVKHHITQLQVEESVLFGMLNIKTNELEGVPPGDIGFLKPIYETSLENEHWMKGMGWSHPAPASRYEYGRQQESDDGGVTSTTHANKSKLDSSDNRVITIDDVDDSTQVMDDDDRPVTQVEEEIYEEQDEGEDEDMDDTEEDEETARAALRKMLEEFGGGM